MSSIHAVADKKARQSCSSASAAPAKSSEDVVSVFEWTDRCHRFLDSTYDRLKASPDRKHISRCLYLAHQIQNRSKTHRDAILAALQLNRNPLHLHMKELLAGVLCELLGKDAGLSSSSRLVLICASLTQDIAMLDLQEQQLDRQATPLNPAQQRQIHRHPAAGRRILEQAGVRDSLWLDAVLEHHERLDGSGYPHRLKAAQISQGARILACCDTYAAMLRPRGDRPSLSAQSAIKSMFLMRGEKLDADLVKSLSALLGMHPPGTWVKLADGYQGIVSSCGQDHPFPIVTVILDDAGDPLPQPLIRDTSDRHYTITAVVNAPFLFNLGGVLSEIWPGMKAVNIPE